MTRIFCGVSNHTIKGIFFDQEYKSFLGFSRHLFNSESILGLAQPVSLICPKGLIYHPPFAVFNKVTHGTLATCIYNQMILGI